MQEEWKDVVGYEGLYEVSSLGRIRSHHGIVKYLKPYLNETVGYLYISLYDGKGGTEKVIAHRIIAEAFLGPCPDGKEVNHKNGDKTDNRVSNLEYVSRVEHMKHSMDELGKYRPHLQEIARQGEEHNMAKLTRSDVIKMLQMHEQGYSAREISEQFPVGYAHTCKILKRKAWTHIEYP